MNQQNHKGATGQAFEKMKVRKDSATPEQRAETKAKMRAQVEALKAQGGRVVENATGHRVTLRASGPVPGAKLYGDGKN